MLQSPQLHSGRANGCKLDDVNDIVSAGNSPGGDYDELPYISLPIAFTQPSRLEALAKMHGLEVPHSEAARVLELGCASGGNLIPLAARFPRCSFLGIDLAERHVAEAKARVRGLSLSNIEIRQGDLGEISLEGEVFDYIICHGVFSWVPPAVQDAILNLCGTCLAPNGIATISYNVLPGWHLRSIIRDICVRHAPAGGQVRERVAKALAIINEVSKSADVSEPYGRAVRQEAQRLARQPSSYILGEFLAPENTPCHFRDFLHRVRASGLEYVCEGDLPSSIPAMFLPRAAKTIATMAGSDLISQQEYCDVISGRTFRRSVLAKAANATRRREPTPNTRLEGLHIGAPLKLNNARSTNEKAVFSDHRGGALECRDSTVRLAYEMLGSAYPSTVPMDRLLSECCGRPDGSKGSALLNRAAMRLLGQGRAMVSSLPLRAGIAAADVPKIWPVAQSEAASGQPWVTSLKHTAVRTDAALRFAFALMDGRTPQSELKRRIETAMRSDEPSLRVSKSEDAQHHPNPNHQSASGSLLARALSYAAANALLLPDTASRASLT